MQPESDNRLRLSFLKKERICSDIVLKNLFDKNQLIFCYPFKCYYDFSDVSAIDSYNRIAIAVPKRRVKHAVDRNYVKRITRESYRLHNKQILPENTLERSVKVDILLIFVGKEIPSYNFVSDKIINILNRLSKEAFKYHENTQQNNK